MTLVLLLLLQQQFLEIVKALQTTPTNFLKLFQAISQMSMGYWLIARLVGLLAGYLVYW